jgi:hypothetical protein
MSPAKPSITFWNRIEPSPRGDSLSRGLQAQVRDPLWFLTRQWQMGEFSGEDAASPAYAGYSASFTRLTGWRSGDGAWLPIDGSTPLEVLAEREPVTPNWRLAVELGQALEQALTRAGATAVSIAAFRTTYPVPTVAELSADEAIDAALVRFLRVCGGRAVNGIAAFEAVEAAAPSVPASIPVPAAEHGAAESALAAFRSFVRKSHGSIGRTDAPAWRPAQLDYDIQVAASLRDRTRDVLARAGAYGEFDWYAFDVVERSRSATAARTTAVRSSLFPTSVSFPGTPSRRWWQFESARFNWADVDTDRRDIARILVLDFMLVHGDDWFVVPLGQPVGALAQIDQLLVRDVFGDLTLIPRADSGSGAGPGRWTMYSHDVGGDSLGLADYFILPPSVLRATLDGPVVEEVRFVRDEQANMVWGVESTIENGIGTPWPGRERSLAFPYETPPASATPAPLRYQLQTAVPVNWIPFVPVQTEASHRAVALERAAMQRFRDGMLVSVEATGRVLRPTTLDDVAVYRINEEEIERHGTRIERAARRVRWLDGSTHLWTSRRRRSGFGEGASGLKFDLAQDTGQPGS